MVQSENGKSLSESEREELAVISCALTSYLYNHPAFETNPAPLVSFLEAVEEGIVEKSDQVLREARKVISRARLLALGADAAPRSHVPKYSEIELEIMQVIDEHEGMLGKDIASKVGVTPEYFRKVYCQVLRPIGYENIRRLGYFPPVKDRDG